MQNYIYGIIIGLCLLLLIAVIKIIYDRRREKQNELIEKFIINVYEEIVDKNNKVETIKNNRGRKEYFRVKDIFSDAVDVKLAFSNLSNNEFQYVDKVSSYILHHYKDGFFDIDEYNHLYKEIVTQLDMVAPYYKFHRDNTHIVVSNAIEKEEYRINARALIDNNLVFSNEWEQLKEEFLSKFYCK